MKKYSVLIIVVLIVIAVLLIRTFRTPLLKHVTPRQALELYQPNGNEVQGNPNGKVIMVEFFGYNCHYCRLAYPVIQKFIKTHPQVQVIYKEYLLFGEKSKLPAYAALAAQLQNKYFIMHDAMLQAARPLTKNEIAVLAKSGHLDIKKLFRDMNNPGIEKKIGENTKLAKNLNISGAPTVIFVGSGIVKYPGKVKRFKQFIKVGGITSKKLDKLFHKVIRQSA